ncbi:MAG: pyrimidine reductase family protein [Acidimicrobiales bacterium]
MRQVFPEAVDPVDPLAVYGEPPIAAGRPGVRLNMITSLDGATSVGGRSGGLVGPADRHLFHLLRALADVVLVGAGTARTEGYGPACLTPALRLERLRRGQPETPAIAVVSRSCRFDWGSPFFTDAPARPLLVTVEEAPDDLLAQAAEVADVVLAGRSSVDLALALDALGARGLRSVVCEGGPVLNAELAAAGLIDELALTLSPVLAGGDAERLLHGASLPDPVELEAVSVCEDDGFLFLLLRRRVAT